MRLIMRNIIILGTVLFFIGCTGRDHSNPFDITTSSRPEAMANITATENLQDITPFSATISWTRNTDDDFFAYRVLVAENSTVLSTAADSTVDTIDELLGNITEDLIEYFAYYEVIFNSGVDEILVSDLDPFTYYYALVLTENKAGYIKTTNILEFRTQPNTAYGLELTDPLSSLDVTEVQTMVPLAVKGSGGDYEQILLGGYYGSPSAYGGQGAFGTQNTLKIAYPFKPDGETELLIKFDNLALQRIAYPGYSEITEITFPAPGSYPTSGTAGYFLIYDGQEPYCVVVKDSTSAAATPDLSGIKLNMFYIDVDINGMSTAAEIADEFALLVNDQDKWYVTTSGAVATMVNVNTNPTSDSGANIYNGEDELSPPFVEGDFNITQNNVGFPDAAAESADYMDTYKAVLQDQPWDLNYAESPLYSGPDVLKYSVDDIFSITADSDSESYIYFTDTYLGIVMGFSNNAGQLLTAYDNNKPASLEEEFDEFYIPYFGYDADGDTFPDYDKYGDIIPINLSTPEGSFLPFSAFKVVGFFNGTSSVDTLFGATKEGAIYRFSQAAAPAGESIPQFSAGGSDKILDLFSIYSDETNEISGNFGWDEIASFDYFYDSDTGEAHVFVLEKTNSRMLIILVPSAGDPELIDIFGTPGDDFGEFNGPSDMLIYDENIFVADTLNHRVQIFKFTPTGIKFISSIGSYGYSDSQFVNPKKIDIFTFDPSGGENPTLFIMVTDDKRVRYFPIDELFE